MIGEGNAPLAIDALLPVPQSAEPTSVATWAYDALMALAAAEATPVSGAAALLIELPHTIVHGHPSGVPYAITLVKGLLMRERFIDGPQSLADICVRSGDHPGIYVALKPFTV